MTIHDHDMLSLLAGILLGVIGGFPLLAQADPNSGLPGVSALYAEFMRLDRNHSGYLSPAEFRACGGTAQAFREADANHDHRLNRDEFVVATSIDQRIKTGQYFADTWITAKIMARLLQDNFPGSLDVQVRTVNGVVHLSGRLESSTQIRRVLAVTSRVDGVEGVSSSLKLGRRRHELREN